MNYQGIIWAGVSVEDLERSIAFYRDVMGLPLVRQGHGWAHFDASNDTLLELFSGGAASPEVKGTGQQSIVIAIRVDDLDGTVDVLKAKGVQFIGEIEAYRNHRWAYFTDVEGNRLEIKEIKNG